MRYALKVYYDGRNFHGSQVQPDKRTVEGELIRALQIVSTKVEDFMAAGRTDRGVSSLGNVYAVTTDTHLRARALNSYLPSDVRVLSVREVHDGFKPRREAIERVYKYFLCAGGLNVKLMRRAAKLFEGKKSFHGFCKMSGGSSIRRIRRVDLEERGDFLVITYAGDSFLWQMARRITSALRMVGIGELTLGELRRYFEPGNKGKFPPAPPENLVLWNVRYAFDFKPDEYTLIRLMEEMEARMRNLRNNLLIGEEMLKALSDSMR
jgi:tRNA pseudouridine38-40 synthase